MRVLRGLVAAWIVGTVMSQEPPRVEEIDGITYGVRGSLRVADRSARGFRIEVDTTRVRLVDESRSGAARHLAVGSAEEKALLGALDAWVAGTFEQAQIARMLDDDVVVESERSDDNDDRALVRELRAYEAITQPTLTKVFAGRGTVLASMLVQLGSRPAQHVLWRRGEDGMPRPYFDMAVEPVGFDTRGEQILLLGIAHWLAVRLGGSERLWQPEPEGLANDVRIVLQTYREYVLATYPRLRSVDVPDVNAKILHLVDERGQPLRLRIDHARGSPTDGRMRDGRFPSATLVEIGSEREKELLAQMKRAVTIRRARPAAPASKDGLLAEFEAELAAYDAAFHAAPATK